MELKKVELVGFKSFPDRVSVVFDPGVTAIVGPNGSGKSNIADAVRWVLGEQSAKMLRGSKMEDVIFAGTERRRPVNYAQVTLVLDNSDRKIPVDYDEVSISRKVFRSGESEYSVNESRCRLRDVQELLMDTGIGKEGYSIIGQGQIDRLLSNKPQDRRAIFEEAVGITKYKSRKEEAEGKLEAEELTLSRISDILNELSARLEPLTAEAEKAGVYLSLKEELKSYEVTAFLGQFKQYREQFERVEKNLNELNAQLEEARERGAKARELSEQYKQEAQEASDAYRSLNENHHELEIALQQKEAQKALISSRGEQFEREESRLSRQIAETKAALAALSETLRREEERVAAKKAKLAETEASHTESVTRLQSRGEARERLRAESAEAAGRLEEARAALAALRAKGVGFGEVLELDRTQRRAIEEQQEKLSQEAAGLSDKEEKKQQEIAEVSRAYEALGADISRLNNEIQELRTSVRERQTELSAAASALQETVSRVKWLRELEKDYEGFSGSVKAVMSLVKADPARYKTVRGTLSDLIRVPQEYGTAVEIALGNSLQNIVTDDLETAKALIETLRREQKGRATFMPLDRAEGRARFDRRAEVLKMEGVRGFADELISCDRAYTVLTSRLLGNVIVTEDFDSAAAVAARFGADLRAVTLKGDIFNIGGAVTGGSTQKGGGILSRKGELEELKKTEKEQEQAVEAIRREADRLSAERQAKNAELDEKAQAYDRDREKLMGLKNELAAFTAARAQIESQIEAARRSVEDQNRTREEHEAWMAGFADELARAEAGEQELAEAAREAEAAYVASEAEGETARTEEMNLRIEAKGLEQEILYLIRSMERERDSAEGMAAQIEAFMGELEASRRGREDDLSALSKLAAEIETLTGLIEQRGDETAEMDRTQNEKRERWEASMNEVSARVSEIAALEKEQLRLENQKTRAQKDLQDLQDRMWEEYQLTYNAALSLEKQDLGSPAAMKRRIGELKEKLRELGPVNVNAITELQALKERTETLSAQRDDIVKTEESLRELIAQLKTSMEKQFNEGFKQIGILFEESFRKLFGGGHALLQLSEGENSLEAGIEIVAQPPGKTLQNMMLLSGGERALTAISLLFAIQQLNPAPFCILDEIEAALDEANVSRFADYLTELCEKTQFIVITHRKGTMEAATAMYGVTMEEKGVSKCISVRFEGEL